MSTKSCRHLGFGKKEIVLATSSHENRETMADLLQLDGFLDKKDTHLANQIQLPIPATKRVFSPMW